MITHPKQKGIISEYAIISELLKLGFSVSTPLGDNSPYDLLIDYNNKFIRVQCKSGRIRKGVIRYNTTSSRMNSKGVYKTGYEGKIDYFMVHCEDNSKNYFFPITNRGGYLRIDPTANKQIAKITFACNYELDKFQNYLIKL